MEGPMIDWARVRDLRDEVGEDAFEDVVDLFIEEVQEVVGRLRSDPDPAMFEEDLHFLKGSALNLGFAAFGEACQLGESAAAAGRAAELDIDAILESFDQSRAVFTAQLPHSLVA